MNINKTHVLLVDVSLQRCKACIIILILNICPPKVGQYHEYGVNITLCSPP